MVSNVPRPAARLEALRTSSVTKELISWITEPASLVTLTVSVNIFEPGRVEALEGGVIELREIEALDLCAEYG